MSTIQAEIYDAFIEAGASEPKARAAAATVATITTNYPKPEELATKDYIEKRAAQLEARIAELKAHQSRNEMISTSIIVTAIIAATGVLAFIN